MFFVLIDHQDTKTLRHKEERRRTGEGGEGIGKWGKYLFAYVSPCLPVPGSPSCLSAFVSSWLFSVYTIRLHIWDALKEE
jgi:hypothetical protein